MDWNWIKTACLAVSEFCYDYGDLIICFILGLLVMRVAWHLKHPEDFVELVDEDEGEGEQVVELDDAEG